MILLDTQALIWLVTGGRRLGKTARALIDEAFHRDRLTVAAISFWEIAMLQQKKRLELAESVATWRTELLNYGLSESVLTGDIGITAAELKDFHGDPADRLITATALSLGAILVTADGRILDWSGNLKRQDARY